MRCLNLIHDLLVAIPAQSGKHRAYFANRDNYKEFLDILKRARNIPYSNLCAPVQQRIVEHLQAMGEVRAAD